MKNKHSKIIIWIFGSVVANSLCGDLSFSAAAGTHALGYQRYGFL